MLAKRLTAQTDIVPTHVGVNRRVPPGALKSSMPLIYLTMPPGPWARFGLFRPVPVSRQRRAGWASSLDAELEKGI